jgi:hypothetical protein
MMGRALLVVGWLATLGVVAAAAVGYAVGGERDRFELHVLLALVASLLLLFSHCWIMFYLIGTGKAIKRTVAEQGWEGELVAKTRDFKNRTGPALMLAMGLAMATFIVGMPVYTGVLPVWVHHALFYLALAAQGWALVREGAVLSANERLIRDLNRRLEAGAPPR